MEKGKEARPRIPLDPEVEEKPQRRKFTALYKTRIVQEADGCTEKGQIGALLRREGLYSSQLTEWRKLYRQGALTALRDDKRGRKKTHAVECENEKLRLQVTKLERRLQQAETIIEVQKKFRRSWVSPKKIPKRTRT
ncbi:MAG: transposase, partial [Candidatus Hinthialibacter sp.]